MTFSNGVALFFAVVAMFLLVIAWAFHEREELNWRRLFVTLAVIAAFTGMGAFAGGHWHS